MFIYLIIGITLGMFLMAIATAIVSRNDPKLYSQQEWNAREEEYEENIEYMTKELVKERGRK